MDLRPIRTDQDHAAALREIERLWGAPVGSPEGDKLDVLATLVDAYESRRWPVTDADPVEMLRFALKDMGHSQAELAGILGSRSRASEVMNRKRALTIEMIDKISRAWGLPREVLARPYALDRKRPGGAHRKRAAPVSSGRKAGRVA
jgi:HTH-type transcriptional regulator/antitoxin HigA